MSLAVLNFLDHNYRYTSVDNLISDTDLIYLFYGTIPLKSFHRPPMRDILSNSILVKLIFLWVINLSAHEPTTR